MSEKDRQKQVAEKFTRANEIAKNLTRDKVEQIQAERGSLSAYLEKEDPSFQYDNMPFDAFERVLMCQGIKTRTVPELSLEASKLQDVVSNEKTRHLAGEIFTRQWKAGVFGGQRALNTSQDATLGSFLNQYAFPASVRTPQLSAAIPISELVAFTTPIDKTYYKPFYLEDVPQTEEIMARVAEGAEVPAVKITNKEKQINLIKSGRRIDATYEALRQLPIDILGYYVARIAIKAEADKVDRIVAQAVAGDGNAGTAATNYNLTALDSGTTAGNVTLKAWLAFKMKFLNPFALTTVLGRDDVILKLMLLNTGTANIPLVNAGALAAAQQFQPINQSLSDGVRAGWLGSVAANLVIGFDRRVAFERIYEVAGTIREVDRWIREQKESLVMTEMENYSNNEPLAIKTLNIGA